VRYITEYVLLQYTVGTVYDIPQCTILLSAELHVEALEGVVTEAKNTRKGSQQPINMQILHIFKLYTYFCALRLSLRQNIAMSAVASTSAPSIIKFNGKTYETWREARTKFNQLSSRAFAGSVWDQV
jgi:hypothetical protein